MMRRLLSVTWTLIALAALTREGRAQEDRLTAGVAAGPELVGLRGTARSPIGVIGVTSLNWQPWSSLWFLRTNLFIQHRQVGTYEAMSYGLILDVRHNLTRGRARPYVILGAGVANTRVDDLITFPGVGSIVGGSDQSTALLIAGLGLEATTRGFFTFVELGYHHRTTGEHGSNAAPLLLGVRFH
jgi:hypothetical protein